MTINKSPEESSQEESFSEEDQPSLGGTHKPDRTDSIFRVAWVFYLVLAIAGAVWIGSRQGSFSVALFVDPSGWSTDLILGVVSGFGLVALWDLGRQSIREMRELEQILTRQLGPINRSEALVLAIISGFSEELFFRGALQSSWGLGWSVAIFTLMHSGPGRAFRWWTLFALVAALVFGGLTHYRETILAAIVAHVVVNAVNLTRLVEGEFRVEDAR